MLAPAPGMIPMMRPTKAVQVTSHQWRTVMRSPSMVSAQRACTALAFPSSVRMVGLSIIARASEMAKSPMSAGTSGTPS